MIKEMQDMLIGIKNFIRELTPRKDLLYIIQPFSVGDFFYTGGLSLAVQKRKGKRATVLIVKDRMQNIGVTYENFEDIIFLPNDTMNTLIQYFYATGDYEGDNYIYGHFHKTPGGQGKFIWDETLHLIDRYKKNVFKIPLDTPYAKPIVPKISDENIAELHRKYILDKQRTIIITPYTYSSKPLDMLFWMFLVMVLTEKGYVCYTSVNKAVEHEKHIDGTEPMTINFRELHYISDKVRCFIGSRVGIFDFLALTQAKTVNVAPFPSDWFPSVSHMYPDCHNHTFFNAIEYMLPIQSYFNKDNVDAQIKLSHPHINDEDVVYSYEEIFNKMLNDINNVDKI